MAGHVYLIGNSAYNWYKIGKSVDAAIRVSDLGILLPFRIEVFAVWKVSNHHEVERLMHEKYSAHRINGEWFKFDAPSIRKLVESMAAVQVEVASGFSNIERDSDTNLARFAERVMQKRGVRNRGGRQARVDDLTKINGELRAEIKELRLRLTKK